MSAPARPFRAVVEAYAVGLIELPAPPATTDTKRLCYAPGFGPGQPPSPATELRPYKAEPARLCQYTTQQVADFLGWVVETGKASPATLCRPYTAQQVADFLGWVVETGKASHRAVIFIGADEYDDHRRPREPPGVSLRSGCGCAGQTVKP